LLLKLERVAELSERKLPAVKNLEPLKVGKKSKFICIDPDDYCVIPAPVYKKAAD
jgi:hypothetical protein